MLIIWLKKIIWIIHTFSDLIRPNWLWFLLINCQCISNYEYLINISVNKIILTCKQRREESVVKCNPRGKEGVGREFFVVVMKQISFMYHVLLPPIPQPNPPPFSEKSRHPKIPANKTHWIYKQLHGTRGQMPSSLSIGLKGNGSQSRSKEETRVDVS